MTYMDTIQTLLAEFNPDVIVTNNGKRVSSFGGMTLVANFAAKIHFNDLILTDVPFEDWRRKPEHSFSKLLSFGISQRIRGFPRDFSINILQQDPVWSIL